MESNPTCGTSGVPDPMVTALTSSGVGAAPTGVVSPPVRSADTVAASSTPVAVEDSKPAAVERKPAPTPSAVPSAPTSSTVVAPTASTSAAATTDDAAAKKRPAVSAPANLAPDAKQARPAAAAAPATATTVMTTTTTRPAPSALQQQIQQQLQEQLQQQLAAAAAKGQQANITHEQIQQQAAAMVQAAAQAQAVVAAAKARNWQPMTAQQIQALSQIQAAAIVQARKLPTSEVPNQVQIQAQALVHAHTQAQIQAGIYKGNESSSSSAHAGTTSSSSDHANKNDHSRDGNGLASGDNIETSAETNRLKAIMEDFRRQHTNDAEAAQDSNSPEFQLQLKTALTEFWRSAHANIKALENQTEQDFKNHNDLPLARIKRIMKSDEDVRMISAEAPVLFAKACELFILDLSIRSWNYSVLHKRRTLQKEDVKEAIQKTDVFDFLVDVIR